MSQLQDLQQQAGAIFAPDSSVPISFGNDAQAFSAAQTRLAVGDCSHWGLIEVTDQDRLQYLHNQSTNEIKSLLPGQGCYTVFITSTARTIDLATVYVTEDRILVLISPQQNQPLMAWLDKFLFPMDRVKITDISTQYAIFRLFGRSSEVMPPKLLDQPQFHHQLVQIADAEVRVCVGSGLTIDGYTLLVPKDQGATVWQKLIASGAIPLGERVWEQLRILQGRPVPGKELTEDYNPLEAGLWQAISFTKGCYIGQETIARLNTYKGVKQRLWGVHLPAAAAPGTAITVADKKVGTLTSYSETPAGYRGLAYVRTKAGGAGLEVQVGEAAGELVALPFLTHDYYEPDNG